MAFSLCLRYAFRGFIFHEEEGMRMNSVKILFVLFLVLSVFGCIRVAGNAGYQTIKDDEVVTKSTGFDLDSSRLVDNRGMN